jgi:hypothetical protein
MNLQDNQNIHGVINGVHIGQHERVDELNQRIASRYFSDAPLEPNFAPRPVQTKQTIFPMVKNARSMKEKKVSYPDYNVQNNFNPGTDNGPPSGIINNIDVETILRNQTHALQHGASQSVYVPSSASELYNVSVVSAPSIQPHPDLFTIPQFSNDVHPNNRGNSIGVDRFFNHTRTQLRNQ